MENILRNYHQSVLYLESTFNLPQPAGRDRLRYVPRLKYLLNLLGNPQKDFIYIHIGGTSGKGTVATMIHSILTEAGFRAGLYTSPHVTTTLERMKVREKMISPNDFSALTEFIKPAVDATYCRAGLGHPSYYEMLLAIAFLYFKRQKCDYVVLEAGAGGRHDSTNVIPPAKITAINLVDFDHLAILGKTLSAIAREKSGLIKSNTDFFTPSSNHAVVRKIFQRACQKNNASFNVIDVKKTSSHQQANMLLAEAMANKLGLGKDKIKAGLNKAKMPCRFELMQKKPRVILDGAHNRSKMKSVVASLKNLTRSASSGSKNLTYRKLYLIIALTNDRNAAKIFSEIKSLADHIFITRYQASRKKCLPPLELAKKLNSSKPREIFLDAPRALDKALKLAGKNDIILVTGSFYLAGELRQRWIPEEEILRTRESRIKKQELGGPHVKEKYLLDS